MNAKLIFVGILSLTAFAFPATTNGQYRTFGYPYAPIRCHCDCSTTHCGIAPPYFALHPPVYYGRRVVRTYGYRPFACPPDFLPIHPEPCAVVVRNIYATPSGDLSEVQQGRQPLRIANPFVDQPTGSDAAKDVKSAGRQPQIVYPAAMAYQRDVGK